MRAFLKPKLIFLRLSVVLPISALAVFLCLGSFSSSYAAGHPGPKGSSPPTTGNSEHPQGPKGTLPPTTGNSGHPQKPKGTLPPTTGNSGHPQKPKGSLPPITGNGGYSQGPEGSWLVTATPSGPSPSPFQELYTYIPSGGVVETDETDFDPKAPSSPAHGTWKSIGEDRFASTVINFFFDAKGNPAGTVQVREIDTFSENGNIYTGSATFVSRNLAGKQVDSGSFTTRATRIPVVM